MKTKRTISQRVEMLRALFARDGRVSVEAHSPRKTYDVRALYRLAQEVGLEVRVEVADGQVAAYGSYGRFLGHYSRSRSWIYRLVKGSAE